MIPSMQAILAITNSWPKCSSPIISDTDVIPKVLIIFPVAGGASVVVPYCYLFLMSVFIIWFSYYVYDIFCKIYVFSYFPFGFEGRMWDLIVSVPDHCLSFYFNLVASNCLSEISSP